MPNVRPQPLLRARGDLTRPDQLVGLGYPLLPGESERLRKSAMRPQERSWGCAGLVGLEGADGDGFVWQVDLLR